MNHISTYLPNESTQHWAAGCGKCHHGLAIAPELTGACELHLERLAQAIAGEIVFCECQAGIRYRVFLLNLRQARIEEARKHKSMERWAAKLTHPEIEWAVQRRGETVNFVPTIHGA